MPSYKDPAARAAYKKAYNKRYYEANRADLIAASCERQKENPEKACASSKKWRTNNRSADAELRARRRLQQAAATPKWADKKAIAAIYAEAAKRGLEVDHVIPLRGTTVCGLHVETNMQLLPRIENIKKGNRLLLEDC